MTTDRTILLVGGGSGGHIYPNLAVVERLRWGGDDSGGFAAHLVVSRRAVDRRVAEAAGLPYTAIHAAPFALRPGRLLNFARQYRQGAAEAAALIRRVRPAAMVATGGFVSAPATAAAARAGVPVALVSLDAAPGRANRWAARRAAAVFSAYPSNALAGARVIGYPLRRAAVAEATPQQARMELGLDAHRPTLLVFAGSQGARTLNRAMIELAAHPSLRAVLAGWQVLHLSGADCDDPVGQTYEAHAIPAVVLEYCRRMDLAWAAASAAVTRAGAGTVAEAWANAVPSVLLPYPFHKDEHQKHNAAPLVELGGAMVLTDRIDPAANAPRLAEALGPIVGDAARRATMTQALRDHPPPDGAAALAAWVRQTASL